MLQRPAIHFLLLAFVAPLWAQSVSPTPGANVSKSGSIDPVFARIPFEQWFTGEQAHIKWTSEITDPLLSPHQRLLTSIHLKIDGQDLAQRRGKGEVAMLIQLRDSSGALWQSHNGIDLVHLQESIRANDLEYVQPLFILPGDYEVSLALFDTATGEHAAARRKLHVAALKSEPLPDAWRDLPAVEFIQTPQAPDSWFLPAVQGRLHLAASPQHPVAIEILVNLTPTERLSGTNRAQDRTLSLLLPALKVLAQTDWGNASVRVSLLDLSHRRVAFDQEHVHDFDWEKAKGAFADLSPGLVDVKTLENRKYSADFFTGEVRRRVEVPAHADATAASPMRVVIVLSSPVSFNPGVDRHPVEAEPGDDYRVFYVRYHPFNSTIVINTNPAMAAATRGRNPFGGDEVTLRPAPAGSQDDQLAPLLKGIHPELFDVINAEQFRKALATMLAGISRL